MLKIKMKILYGLTTLLSLVACGQAEPVPYESLAWANSYYIQHPAGSLGASAGGWLFRGAKDYHGELRVGYLIPGPITGNAKKRQAILSMVCPPKSERIWQILPSENKLVVIVWTKDNKFEDSVDC